MNPLLQQWGKPSDWHGFPARRGELFGFNLIVIQPCEGRAGNPWVWKTEFLDAFPEVGVELLRCGFHLVHLEVGDHFGCPKAVAHGNGMYAFLTESFGFAPKVALYGMSRGALWAYNWAVANPEKTALIYGDNPVCDFKSWPGGLGSGPGNADSWRKCLSIYGLSEAEAAIWPWNPVDQLASLAQAGIPILHVVGDADETVPPEANSYRVRDRYRALGGTLEEIIKPGGRHHPHGLPLPSPILQFFERYALNL